MPSTNKVIISAAGGGKTTRVVDQALTLAKGAKRSALITYTDNNIGELRKKAYETNGSIPPEVEVLSWYTFLLRDMARPYQRSLIDMRISGIFWSEQRSARFAKKNDIARYYFNGERIYSDKIAEFVCECDRASGGAVTRRLEQRFDHVFIDEVQDMAGHDIELIEILLRSKIGITLTGDHRQATFRTNNSPKNSAYVGIKIIEKFRDWQKSKLCELAYETETYRCRQEIADIADAFFPNEVKTKSLNDTTTKHDGVFCIKSSEVSEYVEKYKPQVLRLDVRTHCDGRPALNFGESKGLTFERVLIFPHKLAQKWLSSGDFAHVSGSASKMYVGVSRAQQSVAFVFDKEVTVQGIQRYNQKGS
jgi:DNA helicase-2/ATP-dependent DNA helicase PcrA